MEHGPLDLGDLDELLSSLPACRRCRLNKRRCDTQLPSCHNCSKAGIECVFFDHILQEDLPRSYVFSLLQRLQRKQHENGSPGNTSSYRNIPDNSDSPEPTENNQGSQTSRYMGNLSCLSNLLSVVNDTRIQAQHIPVLPTIYVGEGLNSVINQETHDYLVKTYLTDIHCLYPFLDESLQFFSPEWRIDIDSTELALRQRFILELVYSIASHHIMDSVVTDHQRHCYRTLADGCHRRGLMLFDKVAMDISIPALQAVTLAALHCLFSPQQGNCGQLIGLAARLAIDLSPSDKSCTIRRGRTKMQPIYTSIYCIESQIAATLDRPSLLPEPPHIEYIEPQHPQYILCALCRIQSRVRYHSNDQETVASLSQQLAEYIDYLERQPTKPKPNILALAYETRLLLHPNCEESIVRLLEMYVQLDYVRTFLSPQWA